MTKERQLNRIGVIGIGFVGEAVKNFFDEKIEVEVYDPPKGYDNIKPLLDTQIIFLCVPTLSRTDGSINLEHVNSTVELLTKHSYKGNLVIKSTVVPGTANSLKKGKPFHIISNPEFLTARTASKDFAEQNHIVIGSDKHEWFFLYHLYKRFFPEVKFTLVSNTEAELIKYTCNAFYSLKIAYLNEINLLCKTLDSSYEQVLEGVLKNKWMSPFHTLVPGPDGKFGYGGACFPKDTKAIISRAKELGIEMNTLIGAEKTNKKVRND